jgi:hypothetical protein
MSKMFLKIVLGIYILFLGWIRLLCETNKTIEYLPRNEEIETVSTNETTVLGELPCPAAEDLFARADKCRECIMLKQKCPDCCLTTDKYGNKYAARRCIKGEDPAISCNPDFFFNCPQTNFTKEDIYLLHDCSTWKIPNTQRNGCPGLTPDLREEPPIPLYQGCNNYLSQFTGKYFVKVKTVYGGSQYIPTQEYKEFVSECLSIADERVSCAKKIYCCSASVCGAGYNARCVDVSCKDRINNWEKPNKTIKTCEDAECQLGKEKECYQLENADCLKLREAAMNCLEGIGCSSCFKKIYPNFHYKFVGKSKENVVITWQLIVTTLGNPSDQSHYFYTKFQVENSAGQIVYSSPIHQKSFTGNFSIFNSAAIPSDIITPGEVYFVSLYYFIPDDKDPNTNLQATVNNAQIIAMKVRE